MLKRNKELDKVVKVAASKPARMFTTLAVAGVAATILLTNRAAPQAEARIKNLEEEEFSVPVKVKAENTWKIYAPAGAAALVTIFCILRASKLSTVRSEALLTAFIIEPYVAQPAAE